MCFITKMFNTLHRQRTLKSNQDFNLTSYDSLIRHIYLQTVVTVSYLTLVLSLFWSLPGDNPSVVFILRLGLSLRQSCLCSYFDIILFDSYRQYLEKILSGFQLEIIFSSSYLEMVFQSYCKMLLCGSYVQIILFHTLR